MRNLVLEKFRKGEPSIGTFTHFKTSVTADALSYTGLDYIIVDGEHSPMGDSEIDEQVAIASARGITPFVRLRDTQRNTVLKALDVGAQGLIIPNIKTMEQIQNLVEWGKFVPVGERGMCYSRGDGWSFEEGSKGKSIQEYFEYYNENTLIIPQCETVEALAIVEEIAATEGIDGLFIGPFDLSISMGIPMGFDKPEFQEAIARILKACKDNGKICICFTPDPETAKTRIAQGYDSVTIGLDVSVMITAYQQMVAAIKGE